MWVVTTASCCYMSIFSPSSSMKHVARVLALVRELSLPLGLLVCAEALQLIIQRFVHNDIMVIDFSHLGLTWGRKYFLPFNGILYFISPFPAIYLKVLQ